MEKIAGLYLARKEQTNPLKARRTFRIPVLLNRKGYRFHST